MFRQKFQLSEVLKKHSQELIAQNGKEARDDEWTTQLTAWNEEFPWRYTHEEGVLKPQRVIRCFMKKRMGRPLFTTDIGQHQMWAAQYYPFNKPNSWVTSGKIEER